MALRAGRVADVELAEQSRVIGHHGEVEGTAEPGAPQRLAPGVEGLEAELLAAREAIGVSRRVANAQCAGVEGERGVDVRVSEVGAAQGVALRARLALFGAFEGAREAGAEEEQREEGENREASSFRAGPHSKTRIRLARSDRVRNGVR